MSEENEQGEEKPKDDLAGSDEFEFYFSFTKPLVLDLPSSEDRAIAAAWVQKLEAEPESEEEKQLRLNYLKLLLFVLQRGRLSGIFKKQPPSGPLQPFPQGFSITDMGNWMLDQDDGQPCGGGDARSTPYTIEISNDLREFVASQEIPNFGIQMYYAWSSDDPIHKWASFDEEKFPQFILDKIKQLKEVKSEEKSSVGKGGCLTKKKGCDLNIQDKYSKKKVKTPQEIERAQGRSFHTYMGLVGRMGNFNDKCDDDPDKYQRQEQRKAKGPRRSPQKRCPTNGGDDDMMPEEEYDNLVSGLGGLNTQGKSCRCANPCQHDPDQPKGGPQAFEPQLPPGRNGFNMRGDNDPMNCLPGASNQPPPRRLMEDPCAEFQMPQMGPQQRNNNGCRSRSASPNRPQECPPEDKPRGFPEQTGVCICSKPPCTCPCPRGSPPKATSNANSAGAGNRSSPKPAKQDLCGPEGYGNRSGPSYNAPNRAPDNCSPMGPSNGGASNRGGVPDNCSPMGPPNGGASNRGGVPDNCSPMGPPNGGASNRGGAPSMRPGQAEVVHCYDPRNPDPALYDKIDRGWMDMARDCGNRRLETDYQNFMSREQSPRAQSVPNSRRGIFNPLAQSTPIVQEPCGVPSDIPRHAGRYCPPQARVTSPVQQGPCDYSGQDDSNAGYQTAPNQQMNFGNQPGFIECESAAPSPVRPPDSYDQRQKPDPCRRPPPQAMGRSGIFAVGNDTGRLANMSSVLQMLKQKTEAHREKCDPGATRRSPTTDAPCYSGNVQAQNKSNRANCETGKPRSQMAFDNGGMPQYSNGPARNARQGQQMFVSPQAKQGQQCGPFQDRGFVNLSNSPQMKQGMPQQQQPAQQRQQMKSTTAAPTSPDCYPNNQQGFQGEFEDDDICEADLAAYDSLDACRPESPLASASQQQNMSRGIPLNCTQQGMQQGAKERMLQGLLQGMQQCMPQGMQQGMPQGMQQGMSQGMQQCMPQGMQQGMSQGMQQGMPQGMQQGMSQGMQQGMSCPQGQMMSQPMPTQDFNKMPLLFGAASDAQKDNCGPQWTTMNSMDVGVNRSSSPRPCQGELGDVQGRGMRSQKCPPQGSGPSRSTPAMRTGPPRTGPARTSPQRNGSPRSSPGRSPPQDDSQCSSLAVETSRATWSPMTLSSGRSPPQDDSQCSSLAVETSRASYSPATLSSGRSPPQDDSQCSSLAVETSRASYSPATLSSGMTSDLESWMSLRPIPVKTSFLRGQDPRCQDPQPAACPPPASNMARPPPNTPCPSQQRPSPNYPQPRMNAELQFQDDQCVDDMAEDMGNMDMNDMDNCDQQTYSLPDQMCEDDGEGEYGEEDNQDCDPQNFMPMRSNVDGGEECYDDYQDMNDCDPMPPPQNIPMTRSGRGGRNSGSQGQRNCNQPPPPTNNRNPNCPDQYSR